MHKRLGALLAVVVIVAGACTPAATATPAGTGTAVTPTAAPPTAVKLTVWGRNYTVDPKKQRPWDPGPKAKIEAAHPGLTVETSGVCYDDQFKRIELSKAGAVD